MDRFVNLKEFEKDLDKFIEDTPDKKDLIFLLPLWKNYSIHIEKKIRKGITTENKLNTNEIAKVIREKFK